MMQQTKRKLSPLALFFAVVLVTSAVAETLIITRGDNMMYFVSETGFLTILCAWALAIVMYLTMRKKIEL